MLTTAFPLVMGIWPFYPLSDQCVIFLGCKPTLAVSEKHLVVETSLFCSRIMTPQVRQLQGPATFCTQAPYAQARLKKLGMILGCSSWELRITALPTSSQPAWVPALSKQGRLPAPVRPQLAHFPQWKSPHCPCLTSHGYRHKSKSSPGEHKYILGLPATIGFDNWSNHIPELLLGCITAAAVRANHSEISFFFWRRAWLSSSPLT